MASGSHEPLCRSSCDPPAKAGADPRIGLGICDDEGILARPATRPAAKLSGSDDGSVLDRAGGYAPVVQGPTLQTPVRLPASKRNAALGRSPGQVFVKPGEWR